MPLGNTSYLQIPLMAESDNQKYLLFNNAVQALDDSLNRLLTLDFTTNNITLLESQLTRYGAFRGIGHTIPRTLTIPPTVGSAPAVTTNRFFVFENQGTDTITLTHGVAGIDVVVPASTVTLVLCDGTDIIAVASASGFDMGVRDEGAADFVTNPTFLNFVGNGVAATLNGLGADVTVTLSEAQDDGVQQQTDTSFFNFTGAGVTVTPSGAGVDIAIPGGAAGVDFQEEGGTVVTAATVANFIGNRVTVTNNAGDADVTILGPAVQDEGSGVASDPTFLNFVGSGVTATVNGAGIDVTIPGGISGIDFEDTGVSIVTGATVANFLGNNVTVTNNAGDADISIVAPTVQDEGVNTQADPTFIDFVGAGVTATANGAGVTVTIPGAAGAAFPVDDDGVNIVAAADTLDFIGAGVSVAANGNTAEITIPGQALETQDDGVQVVADTDTLNFTGAGVTTTNPSADVTEIAIPGNPLETQDDGVQVVAITDTLNFSGTGVVVTNPSGNVTEIAVANEVSVVNETSTTLSSIALHANAYVTASNAAAITYTVDPDSTLDHPIGTTISIEQVGLGQVTVSAGGGVTVRLAATASTRAQYSVIMLTKVAANTWNLTGDLTP